MSGTAKLRVCKGDFCSSGEICFLLTLLGVRSPLGAVVRSYICILLFCYLGVDGGLMPFFIFDRSLTTYFDGVSNAFYFKISRISWLLSKIISVTLFYFCNSLIVSIYPELLLSKIRSTFCSIELALTIISLCLLL